MMPGRELLAVPAIAAMLLGGVPAGAQVKEVTKKGCQSCVIKMEKVLVLDDTAGPAVITPSSRVYADSRGRVYLVQDGIEVFVYEPSGKLVKRFGGRGQGPGEFLHMYMVITAGDTLHLFDGWNARHTVMSPDYVIVRSAPMVPGEIRPALQFADRRWLGVGPADQPSLAGRLLHILTPEGKRIRSFDPVPAGVAGFSGYQLVTPGRLWTGAGFRYEVTVWDTVGKPLETYRRSLVWFPEHVDHKFFPAASLRGFYVDGDGLLWTVIAKVKPGQDLEVKISGETGKATVPEYSMVVEVIDPVSQELLATIELDDEPRGMIGNGHVVTYRENPVTLEPSLTIWRLRLDGRPKASKAR